MGPRRVGPRRVGHRRVGPRRVGPRRVGPRRVGPRKVGPRRVGPQGWAPKGGEPKISRFFFPLPPQFSFFLPSLRGLLVEFWWCLKRRGPEMCTFGVLWLSCEARAAPKPPGFHTTTREPANFDFGQLFFSTSANFDFGQFDFGQLADCRVKPRRSQGGGEGLKGRRGASSHLRGDEGREGELPKPPLQPPFETPPFEAPPLRAFTSQPHSNLSCVGARSLACVDNLWSSFVACRQSEHAQIRHYCSRPGQGRDLRRLHFRYQQMHKVTAAHCFRSHWNST